jgi:hypothetical protein
MKLFWLLCVLALLFTPQTATCDQISSTVFSTEFMAEFSGETVETLARFFGPDFTTPINFSSFVDPAALTFSFSTVPGATYLGLPLMLTGTGVFDTATSTWSLSSHDSLGTTKWSFIGDATFNAADDGSNSAGDEFDDDGNKKGDTHDIATIGNGRSAGVIWDTDLKGNRTSPNRRLQDSTNIHSNTWNWDLNASDVGYFISTAGMVSFQTGGSGSFTTVIAPVPEPASDTLLIFGLLVTCTSGVKKRLVRHKF